MSWHPQDFCLTSNPAQLLGGIHEIGSMVHDRTCRPDYAAPGFFLIDLGPDTPSRRLRELMVALADAMNRAHQQHRPDEQLVFRSLARFDQQESTRPHRDAGPPECFLMLGYEPTEIEAEVSVFDFTRCAADMNLSPADFLTRHNPMFQAGLDRLRTHETRIGCFSNRHSLILLVNNSLAERPGWQGVLHTATIKNPNPVVRRVINSSMVIPIARSENPPISEAEIHEFLTTDQVRRRGYDKTNLQDD